MSVFTKLTDGIGFTDAEKKIADYLLTNQAAIESLTISRLTQATYTSNASIMRLCKKLGVQGFRELRHQMIKSINIKNKNEDTTTCESILPYPHFFIFIGCRHLMMVTFFVSSCGVLAYLTAGIPSAMTKPSLQCSGIWNFAATSGKYLAMAKA